jgi:hypothetical protein
MITIAGVLLILGFADAAEQSLRFVQKFQLPGLPEVVVVAEGDFEPRSIGSYSIRVYGGRSQKFPTDDFIVGLVRTRSGTIEAVKFVDLDGDGKSEIVVVMRSVGSGGHVSADAFRYQTRSLEFVVSVSDLHKGANPIEALRERFKTLSGNRTPAREENQPR